MDKKGLPVTGGVTSVTGPEGRSPALSAAERQRRHRAREKAARLAEAEVNRMAPLRLAMSAEAERQLAAIEAAMGDEHRGLPVAERILEASRGLILLRATGNPLLRLAETEAMPTAELARELGCTKIEAARLQHDARRELLDRLFGRAPQARTDNQVAALAVNLVVTPGLAAALQVQSDQRVTEVDP